MEERFKASVRHLGKAADDGYFATSSTTSSHGTPLFDLVRLLCHVALTVSNNIDIDDTTGEHELIASLLTPTFIFQHQEGMPPGFHEMLVAFSKNKHIPVKKWIVRSCTDGNKDPNQVFQSLGFSLEYGDGSVIDCNGRFQKLPTATED